MLPPSGPLKHFSGLYTALRPVLSNRNMCHICSFNFPSRHIEKLQKHVKAILAVNSLVVNFILI